MKEIRTIDPKAKVLLASGFNKEELSSKFAGHPPSGFIRKPYLMREIEEKLKGILQCSE